MDEKLRMKAWQEIAAFFDMDYCQAVDIFDPSENLENLSFNALLELDRMITAAMTTMGFSPPQAATVSTYAVRRFRL